MRINLKSIKIPFDRYEYFIHAKLVYVDNNFVGYKYASTTTYDYRYNSKIELCYPKYDPIRTQPNYNPLCAYNEKSIYFISG